MILLCTQHMSVEFEMEALIRAALWMAFQVDSFRPECAARDSKVSNSVLYHFEACAKVEF